MKNFVMIFLFVTIASVSNSFAVTSYFNEAFQKSYEAGMEAGQERLAYEQRAYAALTPEKKAFLMRIQTLYFKTVEEVNGLLRNDRNDCGAGNFYMFSYDPARMTSANICVSSRCPWLRNESVIEKIAKKVGARNIQEKRYVNFLFFHWQMFPVTNPDPPKASYVDGYLNLK